MMMRSRFIAIVAACVMVFALAACNKQEDAPIKAGGGGQSPHGAGGPEGAFVAPVTQIVIPKEVKGAWSAVVLVIEDKKAKKTEDVKVVLNTSYSVPNTKLKVKVGDFLPDFRMEGPTITSHTADPNNPAVHVIVTEGDAEIFKGWLYSRFPAIHPFQHEVFAITLKEGVKKK